MKMIRLIPGCGPEVIDTQKPDQEVLDMIGTDMDSISLYAGVLLIYDYRWKENKKDINKLPGLPGMILGGTILVAGYELGDICELKDLDRALWRLFRTVRYTRADRPHNDWKCRRCGHSQVFEADGPYENGWNLCPGCGGYILRPVEVDT